LSRSSICQANRAGQRVSKPPVNKELERESKLEIGGLDTGFALLDHRGVVMLENLISLTNL